MIKIAFYGKGGIGKSTTVTNLSVALAQKGHRVLQIGCDPKADSTRFLRGESYAGGGQRLQNGSFSEDVRNMVRGIRSGGRRTVMDYIRARQPFSLEDVVHTGFAGVLCAETGGPLPGQGCAGRAVITALEKLSDMGIYESYKPDVVFYDVLGDVVCGGFAMPMRSGFADRVCILTSGESMSLFAAANIGLALEGFRDRGYAQPGGIILNRRDVPGEAEKAAALAGELRTQVIADLPRSELVLRAEEEGKCLLEAFPDSEMAGLYRGLAEKIAR